MPRKFARATLWLIIANEVRGIVVALMLAHLIPWHDLATGKVSAAQVMETLHDRP